MTDQRILAYAVPSDEAVAVLTARQARVIRAAIAV